MGNTVSLTLASHSARVGLDIRLVNTTTGEIVAADNVVEKVQKKKTNLLSTYNHSTFDETLVGEAARNAVIKVVSLLTSQLKNQKSTSSASSYKVLLIKDQDVFIVGGQNQNVKSGDLFVVYNVGEELIDEDTGTSYGYLEEEIGMVEVVDPTISNGKVSKCKVLSGSEIKKGMPAKKSTH